jgi:dTDP-4-amino-4,6-dideoxygalactose transaminase
MSDRIYLSPPYQTGTELEWLRKALETNYLAPMGPFITELETWLAQHYHCTSALALNSCTSALQLAVRHLIDNRHPASDPRPPLIIASSLTFIASISSALHLGCEVWLVDSEWDSWTLDPVLLSRALMDADAQDRQVLTVIPTDLYGQSCDMDALHGLCSPRGIPILLDAAESLGAQSTCRSKPWATATSFNGNKIVTSSAGGALISDDSTLIAHARSLSMQARMPVPHYEHRELGYNAGMSHLLAAVALSQLETLDHRVTRRRKIFQTYREAFPDIDWMPEAAWNRSTRWLSVCRLHPEQTGVTPEEVRKELEKQNIESRPVWKPLHQQPVCHHFKMYNQGVADQLFREGLCLPSGTAMSDQDLQRVVDILGPLIRS